MQKKLALTVYVAGRG
jgi:hypothetical protein